MVVDWFGFVGCDGFDDFSRLVFSCGGLMIFSC